MYSGRFAARRRHLHHEYHAGVRDGAHARDRHSHGDRRTVLGGAQSVFDRVDRLEPDRWSNRHHSRHCAVAGDTRNAGLAHTRLDDGDCRVSSLLSRGGNLLRVLPCAQSRGARSNRRATLRVTSPFGRAPLLPFHSFVFIDFRRLRSQLSVSKQAGEAAFQGTTTRHSSSRGRHYQLNSWPKKLIRCSAVIFITVTPSRKISKPSTGFQAMSQTLCRTT